MNHATRTALQWLQTLINSPAVQWSPDQRAAAQSAHDAALVEAGPYKQQDEREWVNAYPNRTANTIYHNLTGAEIGLAVETEGPKVVAVQLDAAEGFRELVPLMVGQPYKIPAGAAYQVRAGGMVLRWLELRRRRPMHEHYGPVLKCNLPPEGWECSRPSGHPGPCAATPTEGANHG